MTKPLQDKDAQWRHRGQGTRPIFDPGAAPLGVDDEAGGARAPMANDEGPVAPLPTEPVFEPSGIRITPEMWYGLAIVLGLIIIAAGVFSLTES